MYVYKETAKQYWYMLTFENFLKYFIQVINL